MTTEIVVWYNDDASRKHWPSRRSQRQSGTVGREGRRREGLESRSRNKGVVDLITFWNVAKRRQRIVVVGLCLTAVLALVSVVRPTASGISWRTPTVYDAATTLRVTQPGFPEGRVSDPSALTSYQLADSAFLYSNLAGSDFIKRTVGRRLKIEEPDYAAAQLYEPAQFAGTEGRPLPLIQIRAYELSPGGAVALAKGVSNALQSYVAREQTNGRIKGKDRVELTVYKQAREAEVFQGVSLMRPMMLFLLGALLTFGVAFVVDNLRGGRHAVMAEPSGESEALLGIVRNEPEPEPEDGDEDEDEQPPAARRRWAAPS